MSNIDWGYSPSFKPEDLLARDGSPIPYRNISDLQGPIIAIDNNGLPAEHAPESRLYFHAKSIDFSDTNVTSGGIHISLENVQLSHSDGLKPFLRVYRHTDDAPTPVLTDVIDLELTSGDYWHQDPYMTEGHHHWSRAISSIGPTDVYTFDLCFFADQSAAEASPLTGTTSLTAGDSVITGGYLRVSNMPVSAEFNEAYDTKFLRTASSPANLFNYKSRMACMHSNGLFDPADPRAPYTSPLTPVVDNFIPREVGYGDGYILAQRQISFGAYQLSIPKGERSLTAVLYWSTVFPYSPSAPAPTLSFEVFPMTPVPEYVKPLTFYVRDAITGEVFFSQAVENYAPNMDVLNEDAWIEVRATLPNRTLALEYYFSPGTEPVTDANDFLTDSAAAIAATEDSYYPILDANLSNMQTHYERGVFDSPIDPDNDLGYWPTMTQFHYYGLNPEGGNNGGGGNGGDDTGLKQYSHIDMRGNSLLEASLGQIGETDRPAAMGLNEDGFLVVNDANGNAQTYISNSDVTARIDDAVFEKFDKAGGIVTGSVTYDFGQQITEDRQLAHKAYMQSHVDGLAEATEFDAGQFIAIDSAGEVSVNADDLVSANSFSDNVVADADGAVSVTVTVPTTFGSITRMKWSVQDQDGNEVGFRLVYNVAANSIQVLGQGADSQETFQLVGQA